MTSVVLVIGATGGIGRATALRYADRGARLVLASRSERQLAALVAGCERRGGQAVAAVVDVADAATVRDAVDLAVDRYGRLDVAVHSAASVAYSRITEVPAEVWDHVVDVGVRGTANVAREALRVFEPAGSGHLCVIGSVLGQVTTPTMGAYITGKWAVSGLVRVLQQEARQTPGVHVSLVTPGGVRTPIYDNAATYVGVVGKPPPPVADADAVARAVLEVVDRNGRHAGVGWANPLMRLGFAAAPRVYDALVWPLFRRLGLSGTRRGPDAGNVFRASEDVARLPG
jgi:NAD(P)-dependent dehydrogenase (short-subunit alcohol dehydrogenase family)